MKNTKKFISFLLAICLISLMQLNVYASDLSSNKQTVEGERLGDYTFERIFENGKVLAYVKALDGTILHKAINENGKVFLDGELINTEKIITTNLYENSPLEFILSSIEWGSWNYSYESVDVTGLEAKAIAAIFLVYFHWAGISIIYDLASIVAGQYDTVDFEFKIRYGTDDEYLYYQRYTTIYGDGTRLFGPHYDNGKKYLDM